MSLRVCGIFQRNIRTYCQTTKLRYQRQFVRQFLICALRRGETTHSKLQELSSRTLVTYSEVVHQYVQEVVKKHAELTSKLTMEEPDNLPQKEFQRISKLLASMASVVSAAKKLEQKKEELQEIEEMCKEGGELQELALQEKELCQHQIEKLQDEILKSIVPRGQDDENSAVLEVRAGTGGLEASYFAQEIFQMYQRYCSFKGWQFEVLDTSHSADKEGFRSASACMTGSGVYGEMKHESGVHRVQRVPRTDAIGRVHTSTISVVVLPQPEETNVIIDPSDLKFESFRASGAGGQSVNRTDSAVRITHIPTNTIVSCQTSRSQHSNKLTALKALNAKLYSAQWKKQQNDRAALRSQQIGTAERSEKIRTYNYQQGRITDHRIGVSVFGVEEFLEGGRALDDLISQLRSSHESQALELQLSSRH